MLLYFMRGTLIMEKIAETVHKDFEHLKLNKELYFKDFYKNNYNLIYGICYSILKEKENSEDITQNVFEKIYKLPTDKMPTEYESSWLYSVSKNESLQYIRKNKFSCSDENLSNLKSNKNEIDDVIENENYNKLVKKLDKKQEQIISLKVISGFTFKEIGQILSMPTATVQWYYYKSIKSLKLAISNLAMFIISFIVGINLKLRKKDYINYEKTDNYEDDYKNINANDESYTDSSSTIQSDNMSSKFNNKYNDINITDSAFGEVNELSVKDFATNQEIQYKVIFGVATIFLVLSIIFAIIFANHQQKSNKKASK